MSDFHQKEFDCEELYLPNLVNEKTVFGSGQLPKFGENMYVDSDEKLWLVPTAEVPITGMHQNEVFNIENLPINDGNQKVKIIKTKLVKEKKFFVLYHNFA